jgi:hypothetical protein
MAPPPVRLPLQPSAQRSSELQLPQLRPEMEGLKEIWRTPKLHKPI